MHQETPNETFNLTVPNNGISRRAEICGTTNARDPSELGI